MKYEDIQIGQIFYREFNGNADHPPAKYYYKKIDQDISMYFCTYPFYIFKEDLDFYNGKEATIASLEMSDQYHGMDGPHLVDLLTIKETPNELSFS